MIRVRNINSNKYFIITKSVFAMNKKLTNLFLGGALFAALAGTAVSCKDYDGDIDDLDARVEKLESTLKDLKAQISAGAVVTGVESVSNGVKVTLSDGKTFTLTNGKDGANGTNGKDGKNGVDPLVWEGGVFYTRNNVTLGATINMDPITSFNRTPVAGDTYNVLVTQQDENGAEIASYFCQLKFTQAVGEEFTSEITNLTKATGEGSKPLYLAQGKILYGGGIMAYGPTIPWYKDTITADEYLLALPSQGVSIGGIYKFEGKLYVGKCLKFMITNNVYTSAEFTGCDIETGSEMHRGLSNSLIQIYDPKVIRLN